MTIDPIAQAIVDWTRLKIKLHFSGRVVYFKEKQIWWIAVGQNIGDEQNGKNSNFERPVLILKKFNMNMFLGVPISTKIKDDQYKYTFTNNGTQFSANLSQIRVFSTKRLLRKVGVMENADFEQVKAVLNNGIK